MLIVGCDYHPSFQQIAWVDTESGECGELALSHSNGEVEKFYRNLKEQGVKVRVGIEATGHARWFERLLAELGHELWVGDAAEIKAKRVRRQKNDREDARLLRTLLVENRFPRVWLPDVGNRDLRQLLWHRHRLVQMRTRVMNQLQAVALNEGVRRKRGLWSKTGRAQLESFQLMPWATRRRKDLLELLDGLTPRMAALTAAVEKQVEQYPEAQRLIDASRCRSTDGAGLCFDHRVSGAFSLRQADRQLPGANPLRGLQRGPAAVGTHQQTRQFTFAFSVAGGGAGCRPLQSPVAARVPAPDHAPGTSDRRGGAGTQTRSWFVLDVAQRMGLREVVAIRFARGAARDPLWCEVDHRPSDWAPHSLFQREFEEVIMVAIAIG